MSTGKRLAKRSIIGTRICAPLESGLFTPGVIQSTKCSYDGRETIYSVLYDKPANCCGGRIRNSSEYKASELVGPGFKTIGHGIHLISGQKVYITFNGREVSGFVLEHSLDTDQVFLTLESIPHLNNNKDSLLLQKNNEFKIKRKLEEVRLLESRKSARLLDLDTDYSRLFAYGNMDGQHQPNDLHNSSRQVEPIRRRTSSMSSSNSSIDVPFITR